MGKGTDSSLRLRCVHCGNTETPLWRAGPDGPKTLCNACGVRYKKGKLILFKDPDGNLTAVKQHNEAPVHIPPAPKKSNKKVLFASDPPSPSHTSQPPTSADSASKRPARKVPTDGAVAAVLAKKPRSRSRRTNAGQLPGRYASKASPDDLTNWRSPLSSPKSYASSPAGSPRIDDGCLRLSRSTSALRVDDPLPYQFDPAEEALSPDVSCLCIDSGGDDAAVTLLPMAADPSSAEEFSFAFAELGFNATVDIDLPDRVEALRGLLLDRTRKVSTIYEATVRGLSRLCEERQVRSESAENGQRWTIEDCKNYVRRFAQEQNVGVLPGKCGASSPASSIGESNGMEITAGFMLPEKTAYSSAVENFKALMDSTELVGFAESCMVELLCEDVALALSKGGFGDHSKGVAYHLPDARFPKPISVRA